MKPTLIVAIVTLFASSAGADDVCPEFANAVNVIVKDGASGKELALERAIARLS